MCGYTVPQYGISCMYVRMLGMLCYHIWPYISVRAAFIICCPFYPVCVSYVRGWSFNNDLLSVLHDYLICQCVCLSVCYFSILYLFNHFCLPLYFVTWTRNIMSVFSQAAAIYRTAIMAPLAICSFAYFIPADVHITSIQSIHPNILYRYQLVKKHPVSW